MKAQQGVKIHNRFDVLVNGQWAGYGENIILDQMWTRLCGGSTYFVNIHFGTGTGTPIASRNTLFTHLGTKAAVNDEMVKALPVSRWKRKIVLNPEEFVGSTITEVGIAFGATNTNLVTHAMLKDAEGNPISITKTATDVVTIFATVFVTINNQPGVTMLSMPDGNQLINYLIGGGSAPTGSFGLLPFVGAFGVLGSTAAVTWTSDVPNKKRKTNTPRFGIDVGNGHVKGYSFTNLFAVELPAPGIFSGQSYAGVPVATGDGVKNQFVLPSANINQASLALKVAGAVVSNFAKKIVYSEFSRMTNPASLPASHGRGVSLTPDGLVMAVAHSGSPFVTTYDWVNSAWVKRPDPASLPSGNALGVSLSSNGLIMAVAYGGFTPYVTTYDWVGGAWVKRPDPASLPSGNALGVSLTPDGLIMAVAYGGSPYVTTYDWVNSAWVKRPNPASLPVGTGSGVALTPDGLVMAVTHDSPPYVTTYDWVGGAWVKRPNPASLPSGNALGVSLTPDGLIMAVAYGGFTPYVTTYDWVNSAWVKRPDPASLPGGSGRGVSLTPDGLVMAVTHDNSPFVMTYKALPFTEVTFDSPPPASQPITADYTVDGIHKTNQFVIDMSFEIVFGEG